MWARLVAALPALWLLALEDREPFFHIFSAMAEIEDALKALKETRTF